MRSSLGSAPTSRRAMGVGLTHVLPGVGLHEALKAHAALNAGQRRGSRAEHGEAEGAAVGAQSCGKGVHAALSVLPVPGVGKTDERQLDEGRIAALLAQGYFVFVEALVVAGFHELPAVVIDVSGLNEHASGLFRRVRRVLRTAPEAETCVRPSGSRACSGHVAVGHHGQRDVGKMMPLGEHLRAHQHLRFLPGEGGENFFHASGAARAVAVEPEHAAAGRQGSGEFFSGQLSSSFSVPSPMGRKLRPPHFSQGEGKGRV